jgi:hypothetical protein
MRRNSKIAPLTLGASTVALAGAGLIAYRTMFLIRNFNLLVQPGSNPCLVSIDMWMASIGPAEQLRGAGETNHV